MKVKVLHIVLTLGTGGLENGIVNTINGSDQEQFEIDILCLRGSGEMADRIQNPNSQVIYDDQADASLVTAVKLIRRACKAKHYHIIHTHGWATMLAGYIASKFTNTPIVINGEHGTLYFDTWKQRMMQRFLFNRMYLNLSVSRALVNEISQRFKVSVGRFKAILNGVNITKFQPDEQARQAVRRELAIADEQFVVGSVGRLVEVKNYPSFIRAFALVVKKYPQAKLLIAGDGPMRPELEALIEEHNLAEQVNLLGRREDVPAVMNALDVFVLPSFREGLSNTILEAMASGLPAVVTKVGGSPEIVIDGETGYLFEVSNIEQLAGYLCQLFEDKNLLAKMSKQARQHVVDNYSLQGMVENYQQTYLDLMRRRGLLS